MRARLLVVTLGVLFGAGSASAAPGDSSDKCDSAFSAAPDLVKAGHLLEGRAALLKCAAEPCPTTMRSLCAKDLQNLDAQLPTAVFVAKTSAGDDALDAKVTEGGRSVADRLDGTAIPFDPGPHQFHFEQPDGTSVEVPTLLREGERGRVVTAVFPAKARVVSNAPERESSPALESSGTRSSSRPIPWTVFASGGIGLLATGSFVFFGIQGMNQRADLAGCKGHCTDDQVQPVRDSYRAADVSLAVAVVATGVAVTFFLTRPTVTIVATGRGAFLDAAF